MKTLPGGFSSMRVYASSDCNTLANAVPAAIKTGGQILASVWTQDEGHYEREKQALLTATQQHGTGWLVAITVGSEDLYRKETSAARLAQQIRDVRGMMTTVNGGSNIQIGHVDTWTAWVNENNVEVINASDFVGTDGYPYFQNTQANSIDQGSNLFWESTQAVRNIVNRVKPGAWVWITEVWVS
jgi:glucan endo-1,3-beta-D-glucosidase